MQNSACSALLRITSALDTLFRLQDYHLLWLNFPEYSAIVLSSVVEVLQPPNINIQVWAVPVSLAATKGISFDFFSSRY